MKRLLTLFAFIITFSANAQIDTVIYNAPHQRSDTLIAYQIDAAVTGGSSDSNMVWVSYHYIHAIGDSFLYQPQIIVYDSLNNQILPNTDLQSVGWRSNGTVPVSLYIDSISAIQTPDSLRRLYILPIIQSLYGRANVIEF